VTTMTSKYHHAMQVEKAKLFAVITLHGVIVYLKNAMI
jgi:hypothetical protein